MSCEFVCISCAYRAESSTRQVPYAAGTWQPARRVKPRHPSSPSKTPHSPAARVRGGGEGAGAARGSAAAASEPSTGGSGEGGGSVPRGGAGGGSGSGHAVGGHGPEHGQGSSRESVHTLAEAVELLGSQVKGFGFWVQG